jgi:glutamine amidotransferase
VSALDVAVIDYGLGNLLSVRRGLESAGAVVTVTSDPEVVLAAPRVVLPGVGAFGRGMSELSRGGLDLVVKAVAQKGTPLLGICLGMQMLFETSEEFGRTAGLGLIPGRVIAVPSAETTGQPLKVTHIGWNALKRSGGRASWAGTMLADVDEGAACYFVHSFMGAPANFGDRVADCAYGDQLISAAVQRDNVQGCQFHPEKSGPAGLAMLKRFVHS